MTGKGSDPRPVMHMMLGLVLALLVIWMIVNVFGPKAPGTPPSLDSVSVSPRVVDEGKQATIESKAKDADADKIRLLACPGRCSSEDACVDLCSSEPVANDPQCIFTVNEVSDGEFFYRVFAYDTRGAKSDCREVSITQDTEAPETGVLSVAGDATPDDGGVYDDSADDGKTKIIVKAENEPFAMECRRYDTGEGGYDEASGETCEKYSHPKWKEHLAASLCTISQPGIGTFSRFVACRDEAGNPQESRVEVRWRQP